MKAEFHKGSLKEDLAEETEIYERKEPTKNLFGDFNAVCFSSFEIYHTKLCL